MKAVSSTPARLAKQEHKRPDLRVLKIRYSESQLYTAEEERAAAEQMDKTVATQAGNQLPNTL